MNLGDVEFFAEFLSNSSLLIIFDCLSALSDQHTHP